MRLTKRITLTEFCNRIKGLLPPIRPQHIHFMTKSQWYGRLQIAYLRTDETFLNLLREET